MSINLSSINLTSEKSALNGPANCPVAIYSKSKIGHVEQPRLHLWADYWCNKWMPGTL